MTDPDAGFTMVRNLDTTPDRLWEAWTDPDAMSAWWHPHGMTTPRESVSVDLRVGGAYTYTMVDGLSGEEHPTGGVYRELVPNQRLVFSWGEPGDANSPTVTVSIEDLGELTRLKFEIRGVEGSKGDDSFFDGWESALDELAAYLR